MTTDKHKGLKPVASKDEVSQFLSKVENTPVRKSPSETGKLIFAIDATASREPTWDTACHLQGEMFRETSSLGGLAVKLCYFRGFNEFYSNDWCLDTGTLLRQMTNVRCLGGLTQIGRLLEHTVDEARRSSVQALVFIGDAVEENPDSLSHVAGKLGLLNVPVFMFQEGSDARVKSTFESIARLSNGAYAPFDTTSADKLRALLAAVAVFAAGGRTALLDYGKAKGGDVLLLAHQLKNVQT